MNHQLMGYDRAITMFSPDGRLLQVEYAKKTVKQGSTAIGIVAKDGVVLVTDKRIVEPLVVDDSVDKIFKIDEHIATTAAGIISDARVLVERAQVTAQQHKVTYDSDIDVLSIVKDICKLKQVCTQSGGLRPFGVSMLIAGTDETGLKLYETDPTGIYFGYKATAIGEFELEIKELLNKEYNDDLDIHAAIKLGIKGLKANIGDELKENRVDCVYVTKDRVYTSLSKEEIKKVIDEI